MRSAAGTTLSWGTGAVAPALLLGLVGACSFAHHQAVRKGQRAEKRGDLYEAAEAYHEACHEKPSDRYSCRRATLITRLAVDRDVHRARQSAQAGDFSAAYASTDKARSLFPDDPVLGAFIEELARLEASSCLSIDARDPAGAVKRLRCLETSTTQASSESLERLLWEEARTTGGALASWAQGAETEGFTGAALTLWALAACARPEAEVENHWDQARERFVAEKAVPLTLSVDVNRRADPDLSARICQHLAWQAQGAIRCGVGEPGAAAVELAVDARLRSPRHRVTRERRSVRHETGKQEVANPDHPRARDDFHLAERAFREAEQESVDRRARCDTARQALERAGRCADCDARLLEQQECAAFDVARDAAQRRQASLQSAQHRLHMTPQHTLIPVYRDLPYPVKLHRWAAAYQVDLRVPEQKRPVASNRGEIVFVDETHDGVDTAGLAADPREEPPPGTFDKGLTDRLVEMLSGRIREELARRAAEQREGCPGDDGGHLAIIDCRMSAALWEGRNPMSRDNPVPSHLGLDDVDQAGQALRCLPTAGSSGGVWIGVMASSVTPAVAVDAKLDRPRGAIVDDVLKESPAERAGVAPGDVVVRLAGILVEEPADLARIAARVGAGGDSVELVVVRAGVAQTLQLALEKRPGSDS